MRKSKESLYPKDWLDKAKRDLHRELVLLADYDTEGAGFNLQQAIEKYLKAYLLAKGLELQHVHDLVKLLNSAKDYDSCFEQFRPLCQQVTECYMLARYPLSEEAPGTSEIEQACKKAENLANRIDAEIR